VDTAGVIDPAALERGLAGVEFREPTRVVVYTERGADLSALSDDAASQEFNGRVLAHARERHPEWISADGKKWADGLMIFALDPANRMMGVYYGEDRRISTDQQAEVREDAGTPGRAEPPSPRIVLVLDDYDVLTAGGGSPLTPLVPYVPMAGEIGLHVVLARRVTGASRGLHEPFTAAVRESGADVLLMDGPRTEGALIDGRRAQRQPPGRGLYTSGGRGWKTVQTPYSPPPGEESPETDPVPSGAAGPAGTRDPDPRS